MCSSRRLAIRSLCTIVLKSLVKEVCMITITRTNRSPVNYRIEKAITKHLFPAFPGQPSVHWEYKMPSENPAVLAVVPKNDKPHVVLSGVHILDCNYGPERNKWNKKKAAERREKKQNVNHPQASGSKMQIQHGHKVDCPARIIIKETFILEGYRHVIYTRIQFTEPRTM